MLDRPRSRLGAVVGVLTAGVLGAGTLAPAPAQAVLIGGGTERVVRTTGQTVRLSARWTGPGAFPRGGRIVFRYVETTNSGSRRTGPLSGPRQCPPDRTSCVYPQTSTRAGVWRYFAFVEVGGRRLNVKQILVQWREPPTGVVLKLIRVLPAETGFPLAGCSGSLPTGGGGAGIRLTSSSGNADFRWSVPTEVSSVPASASISVTASRNGTSISSQTILIRFAAGSTVTPDGAPTDLTTSPSQTSLSQTYRLTPSPGELRVGKLWYLRIGTSCGGLLYEYRGE